LCSVVFCLASSINLSLSCLIKQMSPYSCLFLFNHRCKRSLHPLESISMGWISPAPPTVQHSNHRWLCRIEKAFSFLYCFTFNLILRVVESTLKKHPCLPLQVTERSEYSVICIDWDLVCSTKLLTNLSLMSGRRIRFTYPEKLESSAAACGRDRLSSHSANLPNASVWHWRGKTVRSLCMTESLVKSGTVVWVVVARPLISSH